MSDHLIKWTAAAVFILVLFVSGLIFDALKGPLGGFGSGTVGFIISGLIAFLIYSYVVRRYSEASP